MASLGERFPLFKQDLELQAEKLQKVIDDEDDEEDKPPMLCTDGAVIFGAVFALALLALTVAGLVLAVLLQSGLWIIVAVRHGEERASGGGGSAVPVLVLVLVLVLVIAGGGGHATTARPHIQSVQAPVAAAAHNQAGEAVGGKAAMQENGKADGAAPNEAQRSTTTWQGVRLGLGRRERCGKREIDRLTEQREWGRRRPATSRSSRSKREG
jgi:hypothetical protein